MNIKIHIDINMYIDITPPHPMPRPPQTGPGGGAWGGVGWGDIYINTHTDINMHIAMIMKNLIDNDIAIEVDIAIVWWVLILIFDIDIGFSYWIFILVFDIDIGH